MMRREVPVWVAVVVVLVIVGLVAFWWWRSGQRQVQVPEAPFLKGQPAGPGAPPGQAPQMPTR